MSRLLYILVLTIALLPGGLYGQGRTVTPVTPVTSRPVAPVKEKKSSNDSEEKHTPRPASVIETVDDLGNTILLDTISGNEWVDSLALAPTKVTGNIYPLLDAVSIGVDLWPAAGRALGQKQGLGGLWARLSIHNRYFPALEVGLSSASTTPDGMNYTYKQTTAPYFKVGMDYNFFYNSNSDYQIYVMARYGLSRFSYELSGVSVENGYWGSVDNPVFPRQTTTVGYVELGIGIQVKIWSHLSAGWNIKYHRVLHHSAETYGAPWAVPGFGTRRSDLGISLSLIYTIPLHAPLSDEQLKKDKNK